MLLRGLFMTSFLCDDFLADHDHYGVSDRKGGGAANVLITSASSKTSIALAFMVARRAGTRAVGLTSPRNREFVWRLGFYYEVRTYDEVDSIDASAPAVVVDMAGSAPLRRAIHAHFGDRLRFDCTVGATHWDATGDGATLSPGEADLPGPAPEFFFAPGQIQKRSQEWGPEGLQRRIGEAWAAFRDSAGDWLEVRRGFGPSALEAVYRDTLDAKSLPSQGHVLSLHDEPARA